LNGRSADYEEQLSVPKVPMLYTEVLVINNLGAALAQIATPNGTHGWGFNIVLALVNAVAVVCGF
jgi:hypothetical protein